MRKIFLTTAIFAVLVIFVSSALAAINVVSASVQNGVAVVQGRQASANATISWEGGNVTTANNNGRFSFSGTVPADCVGSLSDGISTIDVALANCTPTPTAGVLKTGQTTCYDAVGTVIPCTGTGQDGELQKGAARSYTFNLDGTITDNSTRLQWERLCNDAVNIGCPVINDVDTSYTWPQAFQKVTDLNTANFAGHSDWRLPSIHELMTLNDYGRLQPSIDPVFNNGGHSFTRLYAYWSSTTYQFDLKGAWFMDFNSGVVGPLGKSESAYVRAVRGGS